MADDEPQVTEGVYAVSEDGTRRWYASSDDVPEGATVEGSEDEPKPKKATKKS